jgi:hypothetical protein
VSLYRNHFGDDTSNDSELGEEHSSISMLESVHDHGTRISLNAKNIDWNKLEEVLASLVYVSSKREYLPGAINDLCNVYVLSHTEAGVI